MTDHAIILAAGVGSRLRPETDHVPKCLVPLGGGETFLSRLLRQYKHAGIQRITVVAGYRSNQIAQAIHVSKYAGVTMVENRLYDRTNNMFSLALALHGSDEAVIFGNADVVYDDTVVDGFVKEAPLDSIAVDVGSYLEESMKVIQDRSRRISRIAKDVPKDEGLGNSLDVYKLSGTSAQLLRQLMLEDYFNKGRLSEWSERALNDLLQRVPFVPWDASRGRWIEVDTPEDLRIARDLVRSTVSDGGPA
jgi:choline kinase